jgi:hypothetical protein
MVVYFLVAVYFQFVHTALGFQAVDPSLQLVIGVILTTPANEETLRRYSAAIRPFGAGWRRILNLGSNDPGPERGGVAAGFLGWFLALAAVYGGLFGIGFILYGSLGTGLACLAMAAAAMAGIFRMLPKIGL